MDSIRHVNVAPPSDANVQLRGTEEQLWSGRRGSNPQPPAWEADALPLSYSRTSTTITRQELNLRHDDKSAPTGGNTLRDLQVIRKRRSRSRPRCENKCVL